MPGYTSAFARLKRTSAWHGVPGLQKHARFFPRSSGRASRIACLAIRDSSPVQFSRQCFVEIQTRNASTHRAWMASSVPLNPASRHPWTVNGFPNLPGRHTLTVFSGIFHPFTRRRQTRQGEQDVAGQLLPALGFDCVFISLFRWHQCQHCLRSAEKETASSELASPLADSSRR